MPNSMRANKFERLHRYFSVGWCTGQREIPLGGLFPNSILRFGYKEAWYFKPSFLGKMGFALCYIKGSFEEDCRSKILRDGATGVMLRLGVLME